MSEATIGSALTKRRDGLRMSRVQAAEKVGMSRTTYSSYERDEQRPSVDVFPALAAFLDVTVEEFLILYGATVVAALRPSLERVLTQQVTPLSELAESEEEPVVMEEEYWLGSAAAIPTLPETPHIPDVTEIPDVIEIPEVPEVLEVPDIPDVPEVPEVPDIPDVPEVPEVPEVPLVPDELDTTIELNDLEHHEVPNFQTKFEKSKQKKKKKGKKKKGKS